MMKMSKVKHKIRCDIAGCNNYADYNFEYKKGFFSNGLNLCKKCVNDMYMTIGKEIVPKSPINMLNTEKRKEKKIENKK